MILFWSIEILKFNDLESAAYWKPSLVSAIRIAHQIFLSIFASLNQLFRFLFMGIIKIINNFKFSAY